MIIIVQLRRFVKGNFLKSYEEIVNVAGTAAFWKIPCRNTYSSNQSSTTSRRATGVTPPCTSAAANS